MLNVSSLQRLFLIRHGHTFDPALETIVPGQEAVLTSKGHEQAKLIAEFLNAHIRMDAIFCSGMQRTLQTAQPLADLQNLSVTSIPELNELPVDVPQPPTYRQIIQAYLTLTEDLTCLPYNEVQLADGVSFRDVYQNYLSGIQKILSSNHKNIVVYAHGGTNMILLCHFMGLPFQNMMSLYQENCAINIIDCLPPHHFVIRQINYTHWDPLKKLSEIGSKNSQSV
ncbi:MAG: histidine phosphatase family protein [SAR324 cluster bacterium]|nr:histidine phosphatase family protein [SAR324 cluster bacterium]